MKKLYTLAVSVFRLCLKTEKHNKDRSQGLRPDIKIISKPINLHLKSLAKLNILLFLSVLIFTNIVLAEGAPTASGEKGRAVHTAPDVFEKSHQRQEALIEKKTDIEILRKKGLATKTSKDDSDSTKKSNDEEVAFLTVKRVTEIVVEEGNIISITTSEENDEVELIEVPAGLPGGEIIDVSSDDQSVDKDIVSEKAEDSDEESVRKDLSGASSPEETESKDSFSKPDMDWEAISAVTDSSLVVTSESAGHSEVYDGINQFHLELTSAQKEAYETYFQSIQPYYDGLAPMLMSNVELWWQSEENPGSYFAGSDRVLDETERRKMIAVALYVVGRDFGNNQSNGSQLPDSLDNMQHSRAKDILSCEKVLRKDILLHQKKMYDNMLSKIEDNFIREVDEIVSGLNESLVIRLEQSVTTVLVLPGNINID